MIICGLLWCFYQLFGLSFWRHPFTAEDPLFLWRNKLIYILDDLRVSTFAANFHFWVKKKSLFNFSWMYILYVYKGSKKLLVGNKSKIYLITVLSLTVILLWLVFFPLDFLIQVIFIYIVLFTTQIMSKQLHNNEQEHHLFSEIH